MRTFLFWVLFSAVGTALVFLCVSSEESTSSVSDMTFTHHGNGVTITTSSRKLKDGGHTSSTDSSDEGNVDVEDYHPIDPVPSSKASIRPGPIQHGTPLMPFIPKPSPPDHPKHGGFP